MDYSSIAHDNPIYREQTTCADSNTQIVITAGILQGGGSLFGVDVETKIINYLSIQWGIGLFGFGAGINKQIFPSL